MVKYYTVVSKASWGCGGEATGVWGRGSCNCERTDVRKSSSRIPDQDVKLYFTISLYVGKRAKKNVYSYFIPICAGNGLIKELKKGEAGLTRLKARLPTTSIFISLWV